MSTIPEPPVQEPEYAWELATLYPVQGAWTEGDYLALTDEANRRIELANGRVEFLPMPTETHEALVRFIFLALYQFVDARKLGEVYANGIRIHVRPNVFRLPDVVFLHKDRFHLRHNRFWAGADLVVEVVSGEPKDHQRDYDQKLSDYAAAGIREYWIVDPEPRRVLIYRLLDNSYILHGQFEPGADATSALLPDFHLAASTIFRVMDDIPQ
jgi:Uma2 family endonuclease